MEHLVKSIEDTIFKVSDDLDNIQTITNLSKILATDSRHLAVSFVDYMSTYIASVGVDNFKVYDSMFDNFLEKYYKQD